MLSLGPLKPLVQCGIYLRPQKAILCSHSLNTVIGKNTVSAAKVLRDTDAEMRSEKADFTDSEGKQILQTVE